MFEKESSTKFKYRYVYVMQGRTCCVYVHGVSSRDDGLNYISN